jgi:hypothetical protein
MQQNASGGHTECKSLSKMVSTGNGCIGGSIKKTLNFTFTGSETVSFLNIPGRGMPDKRSDTCKIYVQFCNPAVAQKFFNTSSTEISGLLVMDQTRDKLVSFEVKPAVFCYVICMARQLIMTCFH